MSGSHDGSLPRLWWGKGCAHPDEARFFDGPSTRREELFRTLRILNDFLRGFRGLHWLGPCATVFGSARFEDGHPWYDLAREVGGLEFVDVGGGFGVPYREDEPPLDLAAVEGAELGGGRRLDDGAQRREAEVVRRVQQEAFEISP